MMMTRVAGLMWSALLIVAVGGGCSRKPDNKLPPDMPKGGIKDQTPKGAVAPAPLPPPP